MCEQRVKEEATAGELVTALVKNGRCTYHEDLVIGTHSIRGLVKALMWILIPAIGIILSMQAATLWSLYEHATARELHNGKQVQQAVPRQPEVVP